MTETAQQIVEYGTQMSTSAAASAVLPMSLVQRAFDAGNLELVERALVLQERWEAAQARKAFNAAMAAVRGELPAIVKNRSVSYGGKTGTSYRHEDLAGIASQIDPILAKHGLTYRFRTEANGPALKVTCIISHRDGGYSEENSLSAPNDTSGSKNSIQAVGSTQTYLQRYTLKGALGLAASNDDDGQSHGKGNAGQTQDEPPATITPEQIDILRQAMTMREMPEERLIKWASKAWKGGGEIADITDIPATAFQICLDKIRVSGEPK